MELKTNAGWPHGLSPAGPLNEDGVLRDVYDSWYEAFWRDELEKRLGGDLELIRTLGALEPDSRVLDLACSFGRISNGLAAEGYRVTGVDASQPLLVSARADAATNRLTVEYILCDLRNLTLPTAYDCALLWGTSFGHLSEPGDLTILEKALACLIPHGRLLIETRHWDSMRRDFERTTVRQSGENVLVERHTYDPQIGVQWTQQTLLVGGVQLHRAYGLRRYTFTEMRSLCLRAGFAEVKGFDERGQRLQPDSRRCVVVATNAGIQKATPPNSAPDDRD